MSGIFNHDYPTPTTRARVLYTNFGTLQATQAVTEIARARFWHLRHPSAPQVTVFLEAWRISDRDEYIKAGWALINDDESLAGLGTEESE